MRMLLLLNASDRGWLARIVLPTAVALALLIAGSPSQAGLTGLVYDADNTQLRMAFIDSQDASLTPGNAAIDDCCEMLAGLTAIDSEGQRVFALGRPLAGPDASNTVLLELSLDGESARQVAPAVEPQAVLAWDEISGKVISAVQTANPATTQWVAIDPSDGSVDLLGSESSTCCELIAGLADIGTRPGGGRALYVVGRDHGNADWHLLSVDLSNGMVITLTALPQGQPGFLVFDVASEKIDVLMQTSLDQASLIYRIDPAGGSPVLLATNTSDHCCLTSPGDMASSSTDELSTTWWVGGNRALSGTAAGFFTLTVAETSAVSRRQPLAGNLFLQALVVSGEVVNPLILFRDRFEP